MQTRKYPFLEDHGFVVTSEISGGYLPDDYIVALTSSYFFLKYGLERFTPFIEIASNNDNDRWYDLTLVKALLHEGTTLDKKPDTSELELFLKSDFPKIKDLFSSVNYPQTKVKLDDLIKIRLRQMFPGLKDRF